MCAGKAYKRAFDPGSEPSPGTCSPSVLLVIMQGRADVTAFLKAGVGSLCLPCLVRWGEPTQPVEAEPWPGLPPSGLCSHSPLLLPHLIVSFSSSRSRVCADLWPSRAVPVSATGKAKEWEGRQGRPGRSQGLAAG